MNSFLNRIKITNKPLTLLTVMSAMIHEYIVANDENQKYRIIEFCFDIK